MIARRRLLLAACLAAPLGALGQQQKRVWRIGMLETTSEALNAANLQAFRQGMLQLGYVEGRNYVLDYRSADGRTERFAAIAAEFVEQKVDLILTRGTPATMASMKASTTIPIVTTAIGQPLLIVRSLARPGGNVTGFTAINAELAGKRVQLLKQLVPGMTRMAVMINLGNAAVPALWQEVQKAAQALGIQPLLLDVRKAEDIAPALELAMKQRPDALSVGIDGMIQAQAKLIVGLAARFRLPAIYESREFIEAGGLFSYGVDYSDQYRRAAGYIDRIFKGAKAGELPMEQPIKFDTAVNLKTAKVLGIAIPPAISHLADRVIE